MKNTCGGCDSSWTGLSIAHCGACHHTFSSVALFDLHRPGGTCVDPATVVYSEASKRVGEPKMKLNKHGVWVGNTDRPEFWETEEVAA